MVYKLLQYNVKQHQLHMFYVFYRNYLMKNGISCVF